MIEKITVTFNRKSRDLPAIIPWIAKVYAKCYSCQSITATTNKKCKLQANFVYINLDGTQAHYCRTHLDIERFSGEFYGHRTMKDLAEQQRCERWIKKNTKEVKA